MLKCTWGCIGFDLEIKSLWHAEDIGWPPKKTDKTITGKTNAKTVAVDFSVNEAVAAAA